MMCLKQKICILLCAFSLIFVACNKSQKQVFDDEFINLEVSDSDVVIPESPQTWHLTNKRICVLFGYGYNSAENYKKIINTLSSRFGLEEDGGLIYPLVYPDSFKHGTRGYENDFYQELQSGDKDLEAIIVVGAPDRTHRVMARLQDFWKQNMPYPVIALFPQDDTLGIESTCDIVFEKAQMVDLSGNVSEDSADAFNTEELEKLLIDVIDYLVCVNGAIEKDENIQIHAAQMVKNRSIHRYLDPETGLQSINHFVLK